MADRPTYVWSGSEWDAVADPGAVRKALVSVAGQVIASTGANTPAAVTAGTTDGHILTWDNAVATKMKWAAAPASGIPATLLDAKGDLIVASADNTAGRLPVGSGILIADPAQSLGMRWGAAVAAPTSVTVTPGFSQVSITFAGPAGAANTSGSFRMAVRINNGSWTQYLTATSPLVVTGLSAGSTVVDLAGIDVLGNIGPFVTATVTVTTLPAIGDNVYGGYYAGMIDTTRSGVILGTDASQTGRKYLLIVAPKSLEAAPGLRWRTTNAAGPTGVRTRWDGLTATVAMKNAGTVYEAATYCHDLTFPSDGGSRWYLPAIDELELLYRNLKPTTTNNSTSFWTSAAGSFPYNGAQVQFGVNPSSDPTGTAYTSTVPGRTGLALFQSGGAQAFEPTTNPYYWAATEYDAFDAWFQDFGSSGTGYQNVTSKNIAFSRVRPVRRVVL